jgi:hypothetical protein
VQIEQLKLVFRYNAKVGRLYRGKQLAPGTPKWPGGPLLILFGGKQVSYARVCFALYYGYFPPQARHRNGRVQDNRACNLYDPNKVDPETGETQALPHAGKYRGVYLTNCQYSGRFRGYRGAVYCRGKRHYTPVVETPETARDLLLLLTAQVEWEAQQKENAQ